MTVDTRAGRDACRWIATACVAALLVTAGLFLVLRDSGGLRLSAMFSQTVGLYSGSSVRVLGVPVGRVTAVTPAGGSVRVDMQVDSGVRVPAAAGAVVVASSLVSDRYVQLTPPYGTGPELAPGTVIPLARTATPLEIDDLYGSLDQLSTALGPTGANSSGALSGLLDTVAKNLDGNGKNLHDTVDELAGLSKTMDESKGNLFATVRNLQSFSTAIADSDRQLTEFYGRLNDVTSYLAGDTKELGAALSSLASALSTVRQFVAQNKDYLTSNVDKLASVTDVLTAERSSLAELLDVGPTGLTNFINSYDAATGSIAFRYNGNELTNPLFVTLCRVLKQSTPTILPDVVGNVCHALQPVVDGIAPTPPVTQLLADIDSGKLPPLPILPLVSSIEDGVR